MEKIGLQLCSINDCMVEDFAGSLKKVAEFGYTGVEFAGYGGLSAKEIKKLLEDNNLEATAAHHGIDTFKNNLEAEIEFAKEVGIGALVLPWVDIRSAEDTLKLAETLTKVTEKCLENSLPFVYHNHAHEFVKDNDEFLLDILFQNVPGLLCELDVYWVEYAGVNVIDYMKKFDKRLPLIHIKELSAEKTNVDIGTGILNFPLIIETAKALGTTGFIVEQERYAENAMVSAKNNVEYLLKL